jgi:Sulfotransferase family
MPLKLTPLFVTGCPRSGTTMLASMLGRGRNVAVLPEMQYVATLLQMSGESPADIARFLSRNFRFRTLGLAIDETDVTNALARGGTTVLIAHIIERYATANSIALDRTAPIHWVEHSPESSRSLDLLASAFPTARFIHIVRDPRAVYSSMRQLLRWNVWEPRKAARLWNISVDRCRRFVEQMPKRSFEVRYEDLVAAPEAHLRSICDFAGIAFEPSMPEGGGLKVPAFSREQHRLVGRAADAARASAWKAELPLREADIVEAVATELMLRYRYIDAARSIAPVGLAENLLLTTRAAAMAVPSKVTHFVQNRASLR